MSIERRNDGTIIAGKAFQFKGADNHDWRNLCTAVCIIYTYYSEDISGIIDESDGVFVEKTRLYLVWWRLDF
jgi:hypothetical protein